MKRLMKNRLIVSSAPYLQNGETAHCLMFDVYIALLPAVCVSVYVHGWYPLWIIFLSMLTGKLTELFLQIAKARSFRFRPFFYNVMTCEEITIMDGSAAVTGLLLAFTLPPTVPFWVPVAGTVFGVLVGKHAFGGIGNNIFNPALAGRAFLLAAWPGIMTTWSQPVAWGGAEAADAVSAATPLAALKLQGEAAPLIDVFLGNVGGCIGETSALALLVGAGYLLYKRTITWHIPFSYIGTVMIIAALAGQNPVFHLCAGGLILGAFYMATDVVTSPVTQRGRIIFGFGAGVITIVIRLYGGYPEGVCYAILIMNALSPLIDKYTAGKHAGETVSAPLIDTLVKK